MILRYPGPILLKCHFGSWYWTDIFYIHMMLLIFLTQKTIRVYLIRVSTKESKMLLAPAMHLTWPENLGYNRVNYSMVKLTVIRMLNFGYANKDST